MIKLKNVSKYYYKDGVVTSGFSKINLELNIGEFVVITGESGSGKSTLLNVLSGLDTYEDGEMYINGKETSHYTEENFLEYRRKYVSNIFQNFNLVNSYTVYENIELAYLMSGKNRKDIKGEVTQLIENVGLSKYKNTVTSKLSGGQKQRVAIARALANNTPIIVADEPTGSLDSKSSGEIIKLLHSISDEKLVIVVTHNKKEIEGYATRLIRMHDGRILEDKKIERINLDNKLENKEVKNITDFSKLRLAIRNTFNIPIKFALMFIIFMLITITLISNYAAFKMAENEESITSYSEYFYNSSDKRIVINKKDKSAFTNNDYKNIYKLENIDKIIENDLINDYGIYINNNIIFLGGKINIDEVLKVDIGRLPENDNEIVIKGSKDSWYITELQKDLLNSNFSIENMPKYTNNVKIVGIIYEDGSYEYDYEFYLSENILDDIISSLNENYAKTSFAINKNVMSNKNGYYFDIVVSDKLKEGEVYLKDTLSWLCKDGKCQNNDIQINVENVYYKDNIALKISDIYTKENVKTLLNIDYDEMYDNIIISNNDYDKLFNKGNYQSSVFVKEIKDLDKTLANLNNIGFETLALRYAKNDDAALVIQILKIFKLVVTVILIVTLFFISYFIIRIIYKSRNSYYTTLRTLGSTKKVCIYILEKELICHATIAYITFLSFMYLINKDIINFEYFKELSKFIGISEYIIVYLILLLLSMLISLRYGRKIFKDSIIKTYGSVI